MTERSPGEAIGHVAEIGGIAFLLVLAGMYGLISYIFKQTIKT